MVNNEKLLFMTLGTGQYGHDIAHAAHFSVSSHNPTILVFIVSHKTKKDTLPIVLDKIAYLKDKINFFDELVEEVNDFENLHNEYTSLIKKYLKSHKVYPTNAVVDYTSGTKAMSAALVSAAIAIGISSISYTYGQRGEGGRVQPGSERLNVLSLNSFKTEKILSDAKKFFNMNMFETTLKILNSFEDVPHPLFEKQILFLSKLASSLNYLDKFNFSAASEEINNIKKDEGLVALANSMSFGLEKLSQWINSLTAQEYSFAKVFELVENAKRRSEEGKYDDAIARLYRALEMIGQVEFYSVFNCYTSDVDLNKLPLDIRESIDQKYKDPKDNKIKIGLYTTFDILSLVNNKQGSLFHSQYVRIQKILNMRNNSILAHGTGPLTHKNFQECLELVSEFLNVISLKVEAPKSLKLK